MKQTAACRFVAESQPLQKAGSRWGLAVVMVMVMVMVMAVAVAVVMAVVRCRRYIPQEGVGGVVVYEV